MHVSISTIGLCPKDTSIAKHNRTSKFYITQNISKLQFNIDTYIFQFTFFHFKHVDSKNSWSQFKKCNYVNCTINAYTISPFLSRHCGWGLMMIKDRGLLQSSSSPIIRKNQPSQCLVLYIHNDTCIH